MRFFKKKFRLFTRIFSPILYSTNLPWGHSCEVPHRIWAQSIQPFWRLTDKQSIKQKEVTCPFLLQETISTLSEVDQVVMWIGSLPSLWRGSLKITLTVPEKESKSFENCQLMFNFWLLSPSPKQLIEINISWRNPIFWKCINLYCLYLGQYLDCFKDGSIQHSTKVNF